MALDKLVTELRRLKLIVSESKAVVVASSQALRKTIVRISRTRVARAVSRTKLLGVGYNAGAKREAAVARARQKDVFARRRRVRHLRQQGIITRTDMLNCQRGSNKCCKLNYILLHCHVKSSPVAALL